MWVTFFTCVAFVVALIYVPGFLVLRAARQSALFSCVCAPAVSLPIYGIVGIVAQKAGVSINWIVLVGTVLVVALVVFAVSLAVRAKSPKAPAASSAASRIAPFITWKSCILYLAVGCVMALNVFVGPLDGPDSFQQTFDSPHHLSLIRSIVETGNFSTLATTLTPDLVSGSFAGGSSFYPNMWHCLAAMAVEALSVSVSLAANACTAAFCAVVYPLSMFAFLGVVLKDKKAFLVGSFLALSFIAFPWGLYWGGPLFPNAAAFCAAPLVGALFVAWVRCRKVLSRFGLLTVLGLVGLALLHPNAVFLLAVLLLPFCVSALWRSVKAPWQKRLGLCAGLVVLACVVWVVLYNLPAFSSTVHYQWESFEIPAQALVNVFMGSTWFTVAQPVLAVFLICGLAAFLRTPGQRWMVASFAIFGVFYVVNASTDGALKMLLTGFWYNDPLRIAACVAIASVAPACQGLSAVIDFIVARWRWARENDARKLAGRAMCAVFAWILIMYPTVSIYGWLDCESAFTTMKRELTALNNRGSFNSYDTDEQAFVAKCKEEVGDALVVNLPYDGSCFAYAVDGLRTCFRVYYSGSYGSHAELRESLNEIAANEEVRAEVHEAGIEYVLLLDVGGLESEKSTTEFYQGHQDRIDSWSGISSINDDTPGFEVVLSEGDMRLYRITA